MKKSTRVKDIDNFLGKGTIVKEDKNIPGLFLVKWDNDPPKQYNLGKNPCLTFKENLKRIKKRKL